MKLKKSSPLKLLSQSQPNFAEKILRWSPFKIVSVSAVLYSKMAAITKNRNFFKWPKLLYFKPESAQIWTIIIMMIFLTYITGFFMNFELLPILTDYAN